MTDFHPPIAVLLMAYGSPDSLEDIEPYLLDIRGGRPTSPELVAEIRERYALIGGRSPILDLTRQQAAALEAQLNRDGGRRFRTYVGMRHWQPRIKEAVAQIAQDGIRRVIALAMAPHNSRLSTGAYFNRLDEAIREMGAQIDVAAIRSWHDQPGLIDALAEKATAALARFEPGSAPKVIFTAHSLPARILKEGDPYEDQLHETACLLAGQLALPANRWRFCYQSAGRSSETWLGPPVEDVLLELIQAGEKQLLVVPIGFVCDHVEILYDLDIAARKLVEAHGAHLERSESLNASPTFIAALAELVERRA